MFEEVVARHGREVDESCRRLESLIRERRTLGLGLVNADDAPFDYRAYLSELLAEVLAGEHKTAENSYRRSQGLLLEMGMPRAAACEAMAAREFFEQGKVHT